MKTIPEYDQEIQQNPNDAELFYERGTVYAKANEHDKAIADFNKAIQLDPNDAFFYDFRGMSYDAKREYDKAIVDFCKAIELDPEYAGFYHDRGGAYFAKDEYDRAIADFSKAINLDPDNAIVYYFRRGLVYLDKKEHDKAIADFNHVISVKPHDPEFAYAYFARAVIQADELGNAQGAIGDLEEFLRLAPNDNYATQARETLEKLKNSTSQPTAESSKVAYDKAFLDFQYLNNKKLVIENDYKKAADEYNSLYITFARIGDYKDAKKLAEQCITKYKENNDIYRNRAGDRTNTPTAESSDVEFEKGERKLLLILSGIGFILGTIIGAVNGNVLLGMWFGIGIGGALGYIRAVPYAIKASVREEGFWEGLKSAFLGILIWLVILMVGGPIGLLIQVLKVNSKINKLQQGR